MHLHDSQRRCRPGDERRCGVGRRCWRVPGGGRGPEPGGPHRRAVPDRGEFSSIGGVGLLLAQGLHGRLSLHRHLWAFEREAGGGRP